MQGSQSVWECVERCEGVRGFGFGIGCSGVIQMTRDGCRQVRIGHIGVGTVTVVTMTLLAALPKEWGSFAMTLLATLPLNVNQAGVAAGIPQLTFSNVVPKIQEEWSHHSGRSIISRDEKRIIKKEHNTVAKESTPCCRKCKGCHVTSDHRDDYKCPNIPQIAPHTYLNRPLQQNKAPKRRGARKEKVN